MAQPEHPTPNRISFQEHDRPFHATAQNNAYRENPQTPSGAWVIPATNLPPQNKNPQTGNPYPRYDNVNVIKEEEEEPENMGGKRRKHKSKKSKKSKKIRKSKKVKKSNNTKRNH